MSKLLSLLFFTLITLTAILFFTPKPVQAANLTVGDFFFEGLTSDMGHVLLTVTLLDKDGKVIKTETKNSIPSSCYTRGKICISAIDDLPAPDATTGPETVLIKNTDVRWIPNSTGSEDRTTGFFSFRTSNGPKPVVNGDGISWTFSTTASTSNIYYNWTGQVGTPTLALAPPSITTAKDSKEHVTVTIPKPKSATYTVEIYEAPSATGITLTPTGLNLTCESGSGLCIAGVPLLNAGTVTITCKPGSGDCDPPSVSGPETDAHTTNNSDNSVVEFDILGSELKPGISYYVRVVYPLESSADLQKLTKVFSVEAACAGRETLKVQIDPSELDSATAYGKKINVSIQNPDTANYTVFQSTLSDSHPNKDCSPSATCTIPFPITVSNPAAGGYLINVVANEDTPLCGQQTLTITSKITTGACTADATMPTCSSLGPGYNQDTAAPTACTVTGSTPGPGHQCASSNLILCKDSDGTFKCMLPLPGLCTPGSPGCAASNGGPKLCGLDNTGISTAIGCIPTDPAILIQKSLQVLIFASGGIALLLMAFGAIEMMISMGNPEALKKANGQFISAVVGLLFILFAVLLMKIIGVDILNIPGFGG